MLWVLGSLVVAPPVCRLMEQLEVGPMLIIRNGRLRWYGHVMRKGDEDWVKKCMEYRIEGRRPVGRPRKTWLERVEVNGEGM